MKNKKPNAELVWKQLEDVLVPRLGLNLTERVVYAHLLRHSRLEGQRQLRFSIPWLARSVHLSDQPARQAVRSLAAKGALRLVDRTQAGPKGKLFTSSARTPSRARTSGILCSCAQQHGCAVSHFVRGASDHYPLAAAIFLRPPLAADPLPWTHACVER
jgi:hypothetical protein